MGKELTKGTQAGKQGADSSQRAFVPIDPAEEASARALHPRVTDRQAQLVALMCQEGLSATEAAKVMGADRSWAWKTLRKSHVRDYAIELGRAVLGIHALTALATAGSLLQAKSDWVKAAVARDLMDRAGLRIDIESRSTAPRVEVNINLE
jgi:hypothetical protein